MPRSTRRKPRHLESQHGQALFRWATFNADRWPALDLFYHVPNGGKRSRIEASIMKAEGVRAGMPDYHLPAARGGFIGLWIELKAPGGRLTPAQRERMEALRDAGHRCEVAYGWEEGRDILIDYLDGGTEA